MFRPIFGFVEPGRGDPLKERSIASDTVDAFNVRSTRGGSVNSAARLVGRYCFPLGVAVAPRPYGLQEEPPPDAVPSAVSGADGLSVAGDFGAQCTSPVRQGKGRCGRVCSCGESVDGQVPVGKSPQRPNAQLTRFTSRLLLSGPFL